MFRFALSEYIRNFWFNLCTILLIIVIMVLSTIFISNIEQDTREYRLAEQYIDKDSIFVTWSFYDLKQMIEDKLGKEDKLLYSQSIAGGIEGNKDANISSLVYPQQVMEKLEPRMDETVNILDAKKNKDIIIAYISHNPYGIEAGDVFSYEILTLEGEDDGICVDVYVAGIIGEGQRLYSSVGEVFSDMVYKDFFNLYSYEQTGKVKMIIPEQELCKIKEIDRINKTSIYENIIINPSDNMSEDERIALAEAISEYEKNIRPITSEMVYPDAKDIVYRSNVLHKSELYKYIPLTIIVMVLFIVCVTGIVTIKTIISSRFYGIMYMCGMHYTIAQRMTAVEMTLNSVIATVFAISILTLQNKLKLVGEINCNLDILQYGFMFAICTVIILWSTMTAKRVLKDNPPIQITKNMD